MTDISPLAECDFSASEQSGGLNLQIEGDGLEDLTPLENIHSFGWMWISKDEAENWLQHMKGARVRELNLQKMNAAVMSLLNDVDVENLNYEYFSLESLEDIDSLPQDMLEKVESLCIAGDQLFENADQLNVGIQWQGNRANVVVQNYQTGEQTLVKMGKGLDLSSLGRLPNLHNLILACEPITDLEMLRGMGSLRSLNLCGCSKLTDIQAVSELQDLETLNLNTTGVKDLTPLTALKKIRDLNLNNIKPKDWNVLGEMDFSHAAANGGLDLSIDTCKSDMAFLAGNGYYRSLALGSVSAKQWMSHIANAKIFELFAGNINQAQLVEVLDQHPEITSLRIPNNRNVTDLTVLLNRPELQMVAVSQDMKKALQSIDGMDLPFRLEIW